MKCAHREKHRAKQRTQCSAPGDGANTVVMWNVLAKVPAGEKGGNLREEENPRKDPKRKK